MTLNERPIIIATRGSALALAQANQVLRECRRKFPKHSFELKIIKTTGDKLQRASMARIDSTLPRGLFTKELETALLRNRADVAVHSLKDLPTELPDGLILGGVAGKRADVRDVLIYRDTMRGSKPRMRLQDFPQGATIATSSTRRKAQLQAMRPDFIVIDIRGNVATRLQKLAEKQEIDATVLALAGLGRLKCRITPAGRLMGDIVPEGLQAIIFEPEQMLPCVGQGAIGLEIRDGDAQMAGICKRLNDEETFQSVLAERSFLRAMGGGCQSPVGAYASYEEGLLHLRAVSFLTAQPQHAEAMIPDPKPLPEQAVLLGLFVAKQIKDLE